MTSYNIVASTDDVTVVAEYNVEYRAHGQKYQSEAALEKEFIRLLTEQGYDYLKISTEQDFINNLRRQLEKLNQIIFSDKEWDRLFKESIASANEGIVEKTRKIQEDHIQVLRLDDGTSKNIYLIDRKNIHNNRLQVLNQYEEEAGTYKSRYDVTVLVNGFPLIHIELKRRGVAIREAFNQINRYQRDSFWAYHGLFEYVQLFVISNGTHTKYYSNTTREAHIKELASSTRRRSKKTSNSFEFTSFWADSNNNIISDLVDFTKTFFAKHTILNILTKYCIFTSEDLLLVMRPYQIAATERILNRIIISTNYKKTGTKDAGGYIWHTTGSGKSLTMVMLAKYIFYRYRQVNPKVIIVTDRVDLDNQIYETFSHTSLKPSKATTGKHLVELINNDSADIITAIVNKFVTASDIQEPVRSQDVFILVDESHRTQYGKFHNKMKELFPNACYLGFTGTPLMKSEKNTMMKFGDLIHTYTIADAVADKTILPLYYEGRMVDQSVNQKAIDGSLDIITRNLDKEHKNQVMKKWSQFSKIASSDQRIGLVAFRVNEDYRARLKNTSFNAMLATNSKIDAIRYWEHFNHLGDQEVAVVISAPDTREGHDDIEEESTKKINVFWDKMMDKYGSEQKYESYIKSRFLAGDIDILIVVDKLLTGFDAPKAQVLYVDKPLKEHNLLQAIARVNRLEEGKDRGLIIDFRGLLEELDTAMETYSGAGLEKFDKKDLKGALKDSLTVIGELRQNHSNLVDMFRSIKSKKDSEAYEVLLGDKKTRDLFYANLRNLRNSLDLAVSLEKVYNAIEKEIIEYEKTHKFYKELRKIVSLRYGDTIDTKDLEPEMQRLMDQHVAAEGVSRITHQINLNDKGQFREEIERLGSPAAKADAIRSRISASISQQYGKDPSYYRKFSQMIKDTLDKYKDKRISEREYLEEMYKHYDNYEKEDIVAYPETIKGNNNAKAFYGSITDVIKETDETYDTRGLSNEFAELSIMIEEAITTLTKVDWHNNKDINNDIAQAVEDLTYNFGDKHGLKLEWNAIDKIIMEIKKIAYERF